MIYIMTHKFTTLLKAMEIHTKQKEMLNFTTLLVTILYKLLNVYETECQKYDLFQKESFILKDKVLSDTISKIDVPNMLTEKSKPKSTSQQIKSNSKIIGIAQKHFDLCKSRNIPIHEILKYDLIPGANHLFEI